MATERAPALYPALLFDRLEDRAPAQRVEPVPFRAVDEAGLRESVRREAEDLLGTRCTLTPAGLEGRERTTLEYGLPDISALFPGNPAARGEIAARMEAALAAYEPRLAGARVEVWGVEGRPRELGARIEGTLVAGPAPVPVGFTIQVGSPGGRIP